ncbi:polysaccharide deacetylase family protein [Maribellus sediminis]|uniref:polysaccharide deacetylase family protein n=1 Tax=Maribellus sediminis TaxID=2696285 RepID=UPI001430E7FB|nr:polysaccharide deacetylase family protein [Maribellus sediminis]
MILIYVKKVNPRIEYISKLIFNQILQTEIAFSTNSSEFRKSDLPKLNYSTDKFDDEFYIKPHRLMFSRAMIKPNIEPVWYEGNKYFCESSQDSDLPFDPLAASFYLVSRHEEYTETVRDHLDRFHAKQSILTKYDLLKKPVVNIWAKLLGEKLKERYPVLEFTETPFRFISTIDIDNAWAYKNKGTMRESANLLRSFIKNRAEYKERMKVLRGKAKDPYDTYEYLDSVFNGNEDKVLFFFLLGDYARYDKNISHKNTQYQKLIRDIRKKYKVGIHPSFASSKKGNRKKTGVERARLESILGEEVDKSRQHFLRIQFPKSYRRLIKSGILEDYTMGYSCVSGFRAGICTPYYFYDVERETTTNLLITPFQILDGTFTHYQQLKPEQAWEEIKGIMTEVKKVGGTFVSVWHNETVNNKGIWKGFQTVFEEMNRLGFAWANGKEN